MAICRVLLVEDYPDAIEATRLVIEILGHECKATARGQDAIAIAETFDPDVVLLDLGLPDIDGFEVARQLRERFGDTRPTIIALTGWTGRDIPLRARAAGIDRVFVKPITADVLRTLLVR